MFFENTPGYPEALLLEELGSSLSLVANTCHLEPWSCYCLTQVTSSRYIAFAFVRVTLDMLPQELDSGLS